MSSHNSEAGCKLIFATAVHIYVYLTLSVALLCPLPYGAGHKAMLRSVHLFVCPFSDSSHSLCGDIHVSPFQTRLIGGNTVGYDHIQLLPVEEGCTYSFAVKYLLDNCCSTMLCSPKFCIDLQ